MAEVVWSARALLELDLIIAYLRQFNAPAAERLARKLVEAADRLATFPERGRPARLGTRELTLIWPYIIRYEIAGETVTILDLRHGRQRPPEE
jgi:plasmid stabilization system protein ParE